MAISMTEIMTKIITHLLMMIQGFFGSLRIIQNVSLGFKSRRVRQIFFDGFPLWTLNLIMNIYFYYLIQNVINEYSLFYRVVYKSIIWGIWILPVYILSNIKQYRCFTVFMESVYKKKQSNDTKSHTKTTGRKHAFAAKTFAELIYGILLIYFHMLYIYLIGRLIPFSMLKMCWNIIQHSCFISFQVMEYRILYQKKSLFKRI